MKTKETLIKIISALDEVEKKKLQAKLNSRTTINSIVEQVPPEFHGELLSILDKELGEPEKERDTPPKKEDAKKIIQEIINKWS